MVVKIIRYKVWNDLYVHREYNGFIKKYWADHDIDPDIRPGDMELIKEAKIDFFALNCYRSNVAKDCKPDEEYVDLQLNKNGVKGQFVYPKYPGIYQLAPNPHVDTTDWDWEIDPVAMQYMLRYMWDHYQLPMMITENGYGAHETIGEDVLDLRRVKKDSFYWYSKLIKSNGQDW